MECFGRTNPALCSPLDAHCELQDPSVQLWWRTAGAVLANLLHGAEYSNEAQFKHLFFYLCDISPSLGAFPGLERISSAWESFMTDDHTPIELSWDWKSGDEIPEVRYSIEPIGFDAGTWADPYNGYATPRLLNRFQHTFPTVNLEWFDHFARQLLPIDACRYQTSPYFGRPPKTVKPPSSSTFLAVDLRHTDDVAVKAYFLPGSRAAKTGVATLSLIEMAIQKLPRDQAERLAALSLLLDYAREPGIGSRLECDILGIDCVHPDEARLKVYVRSRTTSFESVRSIMTLGGRISDSMLGAGLDVIFELWKLLFGLDLSLGLSSELPTNEHRTAGILYYFDINQRSSMPVPKVYLPVRHYGSNDGEIAERIAGFMSDRGQRRAAEAYLATLRRTFLVPVRTRRPFTRTH
ncbi:MAG: hypothetical protein Q9179_003737 [Wetmoreana sp. 5 TL-2023]